MDYIRECYYSKMRLYPDHPDVLTKGRWHWCPEGARPIPFFHRFGSFSGDNWTMDQDPPIGELHKWYGSSRGNSNPRYTGQNYCGAVQLWQQGSSLDLQGTPATDGEGVPACCATTGPELGGLVADGSGASRRWDDVSLWLRPEDLTGFTEGDTVPTWPAAPLTGRAGTVSSSTALTYHVDAGSGLGGGLFSAQLPTTPDQTVMGWDPIPLGDWSVIVVGLTLVGGFHGPTVADASAVNVPLAVTEAGAVSTGGGSTVISAPGTQPTVGNVHLWQSTRSGDEWTLSRDGAQVAAGIGPTSAVSLSQLTAYYGLAPGGQCWIPEVLIYPWALSAAEQVLVIRYLKDKYQGPAMPITGEIILWSSDTVPDGFLACDGSAVSRTDFADLFAVCGVTFGAGDGSATFNVPDLRGRVGVGAGTGPGLPPFAIADQGGEVKHQLVDTELPTTALSITDPGHQHGVGLTSNAPAGGGTVLSSASLGFPARLPPSPLLTTSASTGISGTVAGGNAGHNNLQPYLGVMFLIKT